MIYVEMTSPQPGFGYTVGSIRFDGTFIDGELRGTMYRRYRGDWKERCFGKVKEYPLTATVSADGKVMTAPFENGNYKMDTCVLNYHYQETNTYTRVSP